MTTKTANGSAAKETTSTPMRLLLVEDCDVDLESILRALSKEHIVPDYKHVYTRKAYLEALAHDDIDLIICDHKLPDFDSFEAFDLLLASGRDIPFIIVSGAITEERAAQTLKRGAADFLSKNSLTRLGASIREAVANKRLQEINRRAELELKETQDRLKLAMDSTSLGTWDYAPKSEKINWCIRCRDAHGLDSDSDISLEVILQSIDERDKPDVRTAFEDAMKRKSDFDFHAEYRTAVPGSSGRVRWISLRGKVYVDKNSDVERFCGIMLDISEAKKVETDLRDAAVIADNANQAKSSFLANMSHEIRTPLGVIIGFADLLKGLESTPEERDSYLDTITRNGRELTRIIDEILDLSKIEAGRLDLEVMEFDLSEIIADVITSMRVKARDKNIVLTSESVGRIPERIVSDPGRLRQILVNIIGNAVKFTRKGRVDVKVSLVDRGKDNALICFDVLDTGIGITADQASLLFQPFQQADASTTRKFGGTGLGLALSRKLALALGGDVKLTESVAELGSKFAITIDAGSPAADLLRADRKAANSEEQCSGPVRHVHPGYPDLQGTRVLLADDSPDNRLLVGHLLSRAGIEFDTVADGVEACERALETQYDVVLMDIQMPRLDGIDATKKLRESGYKGPVIALTAHAMREDLNRCLEAGCNACLSKPINTTKLFAALEKYMGTQTNADGVSNPKVEGELS